MKGTKSSSDSSSQPETATFSLFASAPKITLSAPYSAIHFSKIALFFTAILPPVIWLAPLSKAIFKSASDFNPPPKSILSFVLLAICSNIL